MLFSILKKKIRSIQELELLEKSLAHFKFFEEIKKTLPDSLFNLLLRELKYETKDKLSIISKQGLFIIVIKLNKLF